MRLPSLADMVAAEKAERAMTANSTAGRKPVMNATQRQLQETDAIVANMEARARAEDGLGLPSLWGYQ